MIGWNVTLDCNHPAAVRLPPPQRLRRRSKQYLCFEHPYTIELRWRTFGHLGTCCLVARTYRHSIMLDLRYSRLGSVAFDSGPVFQHSRSQRRTDRACGRFGAPPPRVERYRVRSMDQPAYAASGKEVWLFDGEAEPFLRCARIGPSCAPGSERWSNSTRLSRWSIIPALFLS